MIRRYGKARIVGIITIVIIGLFILFAINRTVRYVNKPEEVVQNTNVKNDGFTLNINGEFLTYVEVNGEYNEEGATASLDGQNISDDIVVSYYQNDSQVSRIDTSRSSTYIVRYEVASGGENKSVTRVVVVTDNKEPSLSVPDTVTITSDEVASYDVENGVIATDNAGDASFKCENTLSMVPSDYVIKCTARDSRGNETTRNRLIKVVSGIEFNYDGKLTITYPTDKEKNYTYKYSLDNGKTWTDASVKEVLENVSGNVIALVLEDGNYKLSSTYYIK